MQIVIDISEERFRNIQRIAEVQRESNHFKTAEQIVADGTPLPKGHGRLIDADALNIRMEQRMDEIGDDESIWESSNVVTALNMFAPTIIEADAESEDKE